MLFSNLTRSGGVGTSMMRSLPNKLRLLAGSPSHRHSHVVGIRFASSSSYFSTSALDGASASGGGDGEGLFKKVAFIGAGKMAEAIMQPMVEKGVQPADKIYTYDVNNSTMEGLREKLGVRITDTIPELLDGADFVVCAVKPQNLTDGFFELTRQSQPAPDSIFLSIIAGKAVEVFQRHSGYSKIVRSMPNTPATIGQGMTVWSCTPNISAEERKKIRSVLSSFGKSMYVDEEDYIDMATSISGSGPAYIFLLMESMVDAGVHMGFPREKATTLVYHTMLGSTLYAMETAEHPAILRNKVTSPSGTTASAIYELENGKFRTVIKDAMWACYRRSLEMGNHDSNVGPGRFHVPEPTIHLATDSDEEASGDESHGNGTVDESGHHHHHHTRIIVSTDKH